MIHHLKLYGPKMPKRSERYKIAVKNRAEVLGIGMEWMAPVSITLVIIFLVGWLLSIRILYIGIFTVSALLWGYILFNYMHDALHIEGFWMLKNRYLKDRFLKIRGRHDIHHVHLSDDGRMNKNFGICFFLFDRIFKTFYPVQGPFNEKGFQASLQRYDYIFKISE
jgi:sterol desaturase/sphingolipid hydroxylase (fatty acid hydroxylase superfamily)